MSDVQKKSWKNEKRQREKVKAFRLNEEEISNFEANAAARNLTGGDYFRVRCCSAKPLRKETVRKIDEKKLAQILGLLGKWGSNINQTAHALNIAMKEPDFNAPYAVQTLKNYPLELAAIQADISECRAMLRKILLGDDFKG